MFNKLKVSLVILFLMFAQVGNANEAKDSHDMKKEGLLEWVTNSFAGNTTEAKAQKIVSSIYDNQHSLDPITVLSVIAVESGFRESANSNHGAKGLMQVMPRWHKDKLKGRNPFNPAVSLEVGMKVLFDCGEKHNFNTYKTLNCYSGNGGNKYVNRIKKTYSAISTSLILSQFENEQPITQVYKIGVIKQTPTPAI